MRTCWYFSFEFKEILLGIFIEWPRCGLEIYQWFELLCIHADIWEFQWELMSLFQKCGSAIGEHASNTFYKAIKFSKNGRYRILTLGEFFYIKITKLRDVCVGELQMIWTNKQDENQLICSVRLYVLPEHTDAGREDEHGEVIN